MTKSHYTVLLLLLIISLAVQPVSVMSDNVITSGTFQFQYRPGAKQVFEEAKTIEVKGLTQIPGIRRLGTTLLFYWHESYSNTLHLTAVDIETGKNYTINWEVNPIAEMKGSGDIFVVESPSPNMLYYYKVGEGFGTININTSDSYKTISSIAIYGDRIYLAMVTSNGKYTVFGYIDLTEPSTNKTFHKIVSARTDLLAYSGKIVTSNVWIYGDYKIYLNNATYTRVTDDPLLSSDYKVSPDGRYVVFIVQGSVELPTRLWFYDVVEGVYKVKMNLRKYDVEVFQEDDVLWLNSTAVLVSKKGHFVVRLLDNGENYTVTKLEEVALGYFKPYTRYGKYLVGKMNFFDTYIAEINGNKIYVDQLLYSPYRKIPIYMSSVDGKIILVYRDVIYYEKVYVHVFRAINEYVTPAYIKQIDYKVIDTGEDYDVVVTFHIQPSDKWDYTLYYEYEAYRYPGKDVAGGGEGFSINNPGEQATRTLTVYKNENFTHYEVILKTYIETYSDARPILYTIISVTISFDVEPSGGGETTTTTTTTTTATTTTTGGGETSTTTTPSQTQGSEGTETQMSQQGETTTTTGGVETTGGGGGASATMIMGLVVLVVVVAVAAFFFLKK